MPRDSADVVAPRPSARRAPTAAAFDHLCRDYARQRAPIEVDFRQMVDWIRVGDQLTHQIHPYPAKLLPHIAHFFMRAGLVSERKVLDPFCGSGTVALEGSLAGYTPFAADANPLARLITRVKTTPYNTDVLTQTLRRVAARARRFKAADTVPIVNAELWYSEETKLRLERIRRACNEIDSSALRDFFDVCLSATARRVSNADPRVSVPVRLQAKKSLSESAQAAVKSRLKWLKELDPIDEFERTAEANITRVALTNLLYPRRKAAREAGADARALTCLQGAEMRPLPAGTMPLIITSPPYGSAQKYVRACSLSLNWLGLAAPGELAQLESMSIGREHLPAMRAAAAAAAAAHHRELPDEFQMLVDAIADINPARARITATYLHEMNDALLEMCRVLSPGGCVVLVTGNNQVAGHLLRNDVFSRHVFEKQGLSLELSLLDSIKSRGLMTKRNRTASVISRESVQIFRKPA